MRGCLWLRPLRRTPLPARFPAAGAVRQLRCYAAPAKAKSTSSGSWALGGRKGPREAPQLSKPQAAGSAAGSELSFASVRDDMKKYGGTEVVRRMARTYGRLLFAVVVAEYGIFLGVSWVVVANSPLGSTLEEMLPAGSVERFSGWVSCIPGLGGGTFSPATIASFAIAMAVAEITWPLRLIVVLAIFPRILSKLRF
eukprot:TRINITY_DN3476_c0_g1_i1.p1 TRINITY_DN3476_c0_g1~~TRINITY_DN3476_c0_g1_i1.p1  ORF type:complete len:197 (+),score=44.46 TRINITY_DN3476_c0_g1_i1:79-669(+)